ncbi:G kinase-anchoring protein 1-like [Asterias rubens]|uniref:G kinase-anchoring protein 1-like n=1 Tax=Asterias rubens TaxID=7604 RepID=UPI0014550A0C|nr:G kinase-anchoring protein 1-like [Asterias rubens]
MASVRLSSRFDILHVMDSSSDFPGNDSDEDGKANRVQRQPSKGNKDGKSTAASGDGTNANAKKRIKKKKNKQQQQAAELRDIAFNKIPSIPKGIVGSPPSSSCLNLPPGLSVDATVPPANSLDHLVGNPMQWEDWKRKDKGHVQDQFQDDLQKAILASKVEFERQQQFVHEVGPVLNEDDQAAAINRKERRKHMQGKDKPHPVSLQSFQAAPTSNGNGGGIDEIELPKKHEPDPMFFEKVDKDVAEIITKEETKTKKKQTQKMAAENIRRVQHEDDLEQRDHEITEMKTAVEKMKEELAQVKKRNKQLCFILAQGEMKDKADVLKQVDELTAVKDELTTEVSELHAALEQERSKVSTLKSELQRLHDRKK